MTEGDAIGKKALVVASSLFVSDRIGDRWASWRNDLGRPSRGSFLRDCLPLPDFFRGELLLIASDAIRGRHGWRGRAFRLWGWRRRDRVPGHKDDDQNHERNASHEPHLKLAR